MDKEIIFIKALESMFAIKKLKKQIDDMQKQINEISSDASETIQCLREHDIAAGEKFNVTYKEQSYLLTVGAGGLYTLDIEKTPNLIDLDNIIE